MENNKEKKDKKIVVKSDTKSKLKELKEQLKQNELNNQTFENMLEVVDNINKDIEQIPEELEQPKYYNINDLQRKFAQFYLITHNATQAAILAGYAKSRASQTGYELLKNSNVSEYIEYKRLEYDTQIQQAVKLNKESQIIQLMNYIEIMKNEEKPNHAAILKAYDMINKILNLYSDVTLNQQNIIATDKELIIKIVKPNNDIGEIN